MRPEVVFDIHRNAFVGAVFAEYAGVSSLDLLGDLEDFIGYAGLSGTVDTLDMNDTDFTPETMLMPNGIPDAAELFLLQSVLQDVGFGIENGVWQPALWYDWTVNLAQAQDDLAGIADAGVRATVARVVAALMTLGDYGSVAMAKDTVDLAFGIPLASTDYNMGWWDKLSHKGDADADGYTNAEEWAAVADDTSLTTAAQRRDAYTAAALAPGLHGAAPGGGYASASASMLAGAVGCPLEFDIVNDGPYFGYVVDTPPPVYPPVPQGGNVEVDPDGLVALGERVSLSADDLVGYCGFVKWSSNSLRVNDVFRPSFNFKPESSGSVAAVYGYSWALARTHSLAISATENLHTETAGGAICLYGPPGKVVRIRATDPWAYGWEVDAGGYTSQRSVSIVLDNEREIGLSVRMSPTPPAGLDALQTSGTEMAGGYVLASRSASGPSSGRFVGPVAGPASGYCNWTLVPKQGYRAAGWLTPGGVHLPSTWTVLSSGGGAGQFFASGRFSAEPRYKVEWEVKVEGGGGSGQESGYVEVYSNPPQARFAPDTIVLLTPVPQVGYVFSRWEGNAMVEEGGTLVPIGQTTVIPPVSIKVLDDTRVTAVFRPYVPTLTVTDLFGDARRSDDDPKEDAYIHWNIDNDNENWVNPGNPASEPIQDYTEKQGPVAGENDLKRVAVSANAFDCGTYTLTATGLAVWTNKLKGASAAVLPNGGAKSWDMSDPSQRNDFIATMDPAPTAPGLWVEGISAGVASLALSYENPSVGPTTATLSFNCIAAVCKDQPKKHEYPTAAYLMGKGLVGCEFSVIDPENISYNCFSHVLPGNQREYWWLMANPDCPHPNAPAACPYHRVELLDQYGNPTGIFRKYMAVDCAVGNQDGDCTLAELDKFMSEKMGLTQDTSGDSDEIKAKRATVMFINWDGNFHVLKRRTCTCGDGKWIMYDAKLGAELAIEHVWNQTDGVYGATEKTFYK